MINRNLQAICKALAGERKGGENRRGGRFGMVGVLSDYGAVLDLSHCGALIKKKRFCRAPVMATFPITIRNKEQRVVVTARVARKLHVKGFGRVLGLEFIEVTEAQRQTIKDIITSCRHWNALPEWSEAA